jgi:hypothetical protein
MLQLHIENGQLFRDGQATELESIALGSKVKEVFNYMLLNNVSFDFEKSQNNISFSSLRPDIKTRLINALMVERLVRQHGYTAA